MGALMLSLVLARWPIERRAGPKLLWAVALFGLAAGVFALSTSLWFSMAALVLSGGRDARPRQRGQVFIGASNQLGEFESGATAALPGPVASVLLGGLGSIAMAGCGGGCFRSWRGGIGWLGPRVMGFLSVRHAARSGH